MSAKQQNQNIILEGKLLEKKTPSMYQVVLLNDDYTPMEFVVEVIEQYFNKDLEAAVSIMLQVHRHGRGICGVYSKDVGLTKVRLVVEYARENGHPLQCVMEEI
jgi:ATP-dependent Clp protease adaptor protein ClpS